MGSSSSDRNGGLMTEINVTPLVDVVLVLLVLMMVTATAIATKTIPVSLPKAKSGQADATARPLVVAVDESGALFVDEAKVTDDELRRRARGALERDADTSAVVAADGRARHEAVVHALELLRGERMAKIAIVVRHEGP